MLEREKFSNRGKMDKLQAKFIERILKEEGQSMLDEQSRRIRDFGINAQGNLARNRFKESRESGAMGAELSMSFVKYLRFNDMKRRRIKAAMDDAPRKRGFSIYKKHYPLYNAVMYGHLNEIIKRVAYGFSDEVVRELQQEEKL